MHSVLMLLFGPPWSSAAVVLLIGDLLSVATIPSVLLRRDGRPLAALSWILALAVLPYVGVVCWWTLGREVLERRTRQRRAANEAFCELCPPRADSAALSETLASIVPFAANESRHTQGVFAPASGHISILVDGVDAFAAMEQAIEAAEHEVRALFYIWKDDDTSRRWARLAAHKAREGVSVRVLVDAVGGYQFLRKLAPLIREAGGEVARSVPPRFVPWAPTFNFRNHRKLLVVDGQVAFFGGMNIGDEYHDGWHDLAFEARGDVVRDLDDVFREDWFAATGDELLELAAPDPSGANGVATVIASGPERDENRLHDAFFLAVTHASERVWLATPYFVPSAAIMAALRGAALRGVDVRVIVPIQSDVPVVGWASRSYFPDLFRAGIAVYEYRPRFSHAKAIVVDSDITIVGSPNVDVRSFRLNFELACVVESTSLNSAVASVLGSDMSNSERVDPDAFGDRPMWGRLVDSGAHLLSPLL